MRDLQSLQHRIHPLDRAEPGQKCRTHAQSQIGGELLRNRAAQFPVMLKHRRHASSKEQIERLIQTEVDAILGQDLGKTAATDQFAVDQHTVAVEDDEVRLGHWIGRFAPQASITMRSYAQSMSNSSAFSEKGLGSWVKAEGLGQSPCRQRKLRQGTAYSVVFRTISTRA